VGGYPLSCPLGSLSWRPRHPHGGWTSSRSPAAVSLQFVVLCPFGPLSRRRCACERNGGGRGCQPLSREFCSGVGAAPGEGLRRGARRERRGVLPRRQTAPARDTAGRRSATRHAWCRSDRGISAVPESVAASPISAGPNAVRRPAGAAAPRAVAPSHPHGELAFSGHPWRPSSASRRPKRRRKLRERRLRRRSSNGCGELARPPPEALVARSIEPTMRTSRLRALSSHRA
jgi:hypothetical protein